MAGFSGASGVDDAAALLPAAVAASFFYRKNVFTLQINIVPA